jgi:two-component system, sporulation sensor kinase C
LAFPPFLIPCYSLSLGRRMEKEKVPRQARGKWRGQAKGQDSKDPHAQIVERGPQAILVVQDGRLKFANSRAREFLRQPIEKLGPESLAGFIHPDDRAMVLGYYERRLRGEEVPKIYAFRLVNDQGQTRWAEVSVNLIDWDGRPATLVLAENITSRKQMELALQEGERTIRALLDASPNVEFLIDTQGKILAANETFQRIFGGDGRPVVGMNMAVLEYPEEARVNAEKTIEVIRSGKPVFFEHEFRGMWVEKSFYPVLDDRGRVSKLACYGRVITEQKRAEQTLRESERRYRLLADHATDFIWTMDWNLKLTYASPGVTRLRGYTPEEVMAEPLEQAFRPDSWALVKRVYAEELGEEQKNSRDLSRTRTLELEYRCKDGSTVWAESKISAIRDAQGKIVEILGVTRDITERKQAEEALRRGEAAARRLAGENAVMAEVTRIISSSLNIGEVYERFAEEMRKLLDFENLTVVTMNIEESFVTITYVAGLPVPGREVGTVIPLEGTSAGEVYRTGSSLFIQKESLAEAVKKMPKLRAALDAGMQSMIVVPLISEGRVIGILNLLSSRPDAYTRADLEIAEKVSAQISGAIANAQLFGKCKQAEEALQRSQRLFSTIFRLNPAAVILSTLADGKCVDANEAYAELTGYTRGELIGRTTVELNIWVSAQERQRVVTELAQKGRMENVELTLRRKTGEFISTLAGGEVITLEGQRYIVSCFVDISERRRTEEALQESEAKFRALVHNAADMIFLHLMTEEGKPGRFIEVNDLACQKLEYTREELLARSAREITLGYEEVSPSIFQQIAPAAEEAGGQPRITFEAVLMSKGGNRIPAEISFEAFLLKGQKVGLAIARDITERKRTETELADYRAHLEQMVEERTARIHQLEQQRGEIEKMAATGVLAARIAHEINNPLAGIKGAFMLIQEAIPPEHRYYHYVGSIHQEINRIARIVRQMFEIYRPPEEAREELPIDQMIQDVASLLNPDCRDRKVSFELDLSPTKVRLPAGPVRQVLFNILKNAVEASPSEGRVKVSARERGEGVAIQIHDQGPGIPEANRPHVFKPFFTTKVDPQKGLGLGLSISHDIIKNLGGSIRFTGRPGKGTIFQITLPGKEKKKVGSP